ncbi:DNase I-like protein, partial [Ramicandelaber brevisporus]
MGRDSASDDIALSRDVRDAFILRELHLRSSAEFIESGSLRIVAGTWNVNGRPATESLRTWLRPRPVPPPTSEPVSPSIAPTDQIHTDLYVVGLQEVDLSKEAYLVLDSTKEQEWSRAIELAINSSSLPQHPQYRKVASKQLIGMLVLVYARLEIADDIHDIRVDSVGTGIMGIMGNKGGVAIRLMYQFTTMCFVNSHLAHDVTQIERRNQDYMDICRRMTFNDRYQQNDTLSSIDRPKLLWIGDLNYRVPLTDERVRMTLLGGQYDVLLEHDQLRTVQKEGQAFADFREGEIRFPPTFKYEIGSHALDEKRVPSWCDRVLWWTRQPSSIEAPYYSPTSSYSLSDHKPVAAVFDVNVKCFNKQKYTETHDALVREFDRLESTCVP